MGASFKTVDVDLFVNNLTNVDDFTWVETSFEAVNSKRGYRVRPRTIGLNIGYDF